VPTLPLADKLLYATAGIGNNALFWAQSLWVIYFYSGGGDLPERVPIGVIGVALGIGKFIEIFDDPLIGWWSDRTRSRWGRRIPFILFGAPVLGLSFWLLWTPPAADATALNVVWFFVTIELFFLARTVVEAPYEALQAEITTTSTERVSLGAWKVSMAIVGVVVGLVFSPLLIGALGYGGMGLLLGVVAVVTVYVMLFGLWRRGTLSIGDVPDEQPPLIGSLLGALRSRPFQALAASFMLFNLGYQLLVALLPFYLTEIVAGTERDVTWFTGGVTLMALLALPALNRAAGRFSKRTLYAAGMASLGVYLVVLAVGAFVPLVPGVTLFAQALVLISLTGLGFSAMWIFPGAMVADIIDEDARRTGQGRAAIFYGMFKTLEKLAQSASAVVFGVVLGAFGSTAEDPLGIQLIMPIAGVAVLAGFVAVWVGYHIREAPSEGSLLADAASGA
ncbi:MAG TPA: MFS transporter, partial [Candidatus Limnocylindria bacterium]|nr:MFS transporter [Candidatus Limnocylindria bacterium]